MRDVERESVGCDVERIEDLALETGLEDRCGERGGQGPALRDVHVTRLAAFGGEVERERALRDRRVRVIRRRAVEAANGAELGVEVTRARAGGDDR